MSGWDIDAGSNGDNKEKVNFTKIPEGITKMRILSKVPHQHFSHWMPQFQRSAICPGRGCPICDMRKQQKANDIPETYQNRKLFGLNIFNHTTNKVELMEQGITFISDLRDVMEDVTTGDESEEREPQLLHDVILKVKRRGMNKDNTKYRIDVDEVAPLEGKLKEAFDNQIDLDEYFKPQSPEQILALLKVTENFPEAWIEIALNNETSADESEEAFEAE